MKILTFTSLFPNAVQRDFGVFVYQRVAALANRPGNSVHVMAPVPYFPSWIPAKRWRKFSAVPKRESVGSLEVSHPRYPLLPGIMPLHGLLMYFGCLFEARRLHRKHHFDCIDGHYIYPDGFAAVLLGKALGIPVFLSARGTDINVFPTFRLIRPLIVWSLQRAMGIVTVSAALKETMTTLGVESRKIQVIGNGVDPRRFHSLDQKTARRELRIPNEFRVIISVGSLIPAKSHELVISAVARLRSKGGPRTRLYLIGDGPQRARLTALVSELHLNDEVFLVGKQPNESLKQWFSAGDVSCLASLREGMPNVVLESLACGTPVVATRVGGVPEVLVSERLGILVEPTLDSLAGGLEAALVRLWDREFIARHAQTRTWDTVAEEVEKYFSSCSGPSVSSNASVK
jgi:teichuronic acid biosynthesis glycosyltransferase TuaC